MSRLHGRSRSSLRLCLLLLVVDGKSQNASRRPYPSQRQRGRSNHRWSSLMIKRSPQLEESFEDHSTPKSSSMLLPRWGWSRGDLIERGAATTWVLPQQTSTLTLENGDIPPMRAKIHHRLDDSKATVARQISGGAYGRWGKFNHLWELSGRRGTLICHTNIKTINISNILEFCQPKYLGFASGGLK
jgi:hypothetical protein